MSNKPKKYPAGTPVTLEMLRDIFASLEYTHETQAVAKWIEPPKPEPKDGELWLVQNDDSYTYSLWFYKGRYYCYQNQNGQFSSLVSRKVTPIKRLIPPEEEA